MPIVSLSILNMSGDYGFYGDVKKDPIFFRYNPDNPVNPGNPD